MRDTFTPIEHLLMAIDSCIRRGYPATGRRLLSNAFKRWHPETESEMALGLTLEAFLGSEGEGEYADAAPLRAAYLDAMVEQGFDRAETERHIDAPFCLDDSPPLW